VHILEMLSLVRISWCCSRGVRTSVWSEDDELKLYKFKKLRK